MVSRAAGGTEFEDADAALHQACFLMVVWSTEVSPYANPKCPSGEQLPNWIRRLFLHPIPLHRAEPASSGGAAPTLNRAIRCHRNTFLTSALSLGNSIAIRPIAPEREYGFSAPTSIDRSAA